MNKMIEVNDVSIKFKIYNDKILSLKEMVAKVLQKKLIYKNFWALKHISFQIEKGDIVGIIGTNGSGKSTLLKIISGIMKPSEGTILIHGNVVPMLELGSGFDYNLTGRENIFLNGAVLGYSEEFLKSKYDEIVEFSELGEFINMPIRNYSSGMVMRLAFSIATMVIPDILIVDEILAVGDEAFQHKSFARMKQLMSGGTTVLIVSHSLNQIRELCNKVIWLDHGSIVSQGNTQEICDLYSQRLNGV